MPPPRKTFQSDLADAIKAAEAAGVRIGTVPAMLNPKVATVAYLRSLMAPRQKDCKQCVDRGIVCRPTNLHTAGCYDCLWTGRCSWAEAFRKKYDIRIASKCGSYEKAEELGLRCLPEGAVWGSRNAQPEEMRTGIPMKREAEETNAQESDAEEQAEEKADVLKSVEGKLDDLVEQGKRIEALLKELTSRDMKEAPASESDVEIVLVEPAAKRRRVHESPPVAGPSGTRRNSGRQPSKARSSSNSRESPV
ncbi:hypothetical protein L226DRAFT_576939 [Lentinus tigrinus ALCF2SS1-7]|uniref:uncharacterized protein n=1 Tax=Lentinus tigrinus ALCF2SS1-7 TaxID=1328758 RepID=UPI0011663C13|nr:hypothetical protein L226DRAFT_576939 [Lentinus tigrinus ALCF2SS1-7]